MYSSRGTKFTISSDCHYLEATLHVVYKDTTKGFEHYLSFLIRQVGQCSEADDTNEGDQEWYFVDIDYVD